MRMEKPRTQPEDIPKVHPNLPSAATLDSTPNLPHTGPRPWYHQITLDLLVLILRNSIFHPFIVIIFILSIYATQRHKIHPTLAIGSFVWFSILILFIWLKALSHRICYGLPREVIWEEDQDGKQGGEVAVVTGGASGLGRCLVEMLLRKGAKVAVLDVKGPDVEMREEWMSDDWEEGDADGRLCWCICDLSQVEEVEKAAERIRKELGNPTILINNAARPITPISLLNPPTTNPTTTLTEIQQTFAINTLPAFQLLLTFLPTLITSPRGGHIITISSILPHLCPVSLSAYNSSKSALSALHATLTHELRQHHHHHKIKPVLVETGLMSTSLFLGPRVKLQLPPYAQHLGPTLEVVEVARRIVELIDQGDAGVVRMPVYAALVARWYAVLPGMVRRMVRWVGAIDDAVGGQKRD